VTLVKMELNEFMTLFTIHTLCRKVRLPISGVAKHYALSALSLPQFLNFRQLLLLLTTHHYLYTQTHWIPEVWSPFELLLLLK